MNVQDDEQTKSDDEGLRQALIVSRMQQHGESSSKMMEGNIFKDLSTLEEELNEQEENMILDFANKEVGVKELAK